jgi:CBS domain-containing protein
VQHEEIRMTTMDSAETTFHGPDASVRTYLTADVVTIASTASLRDAALAMAEASVGVLVVGTTKDVAALVSERDVVRAVADGVDLDGTTAAEIGSTELFWIDVDDTVGDAAEEMMEDYVRHVLVRDQRGLVGILSMRDVLSAYIT